MSPDAVREALQEASSSSPLSPKMGSLLPPLTDPEIHQLAKAAAAGKTLALLLEDYDKIPNIQDEALRGIWVVARELERAIKKAREMLATKVKQIGPRRFWRR
jgi:hypothetical protein